MNVRRILILGTLCFCGYQPAFAAPGDLDPSFADGGRLRMGFGSPHRSVGYAVAAQADGKLVLGGDCYFGTYPEFTLLRYNTDGSLDASFGDDGKVLTALWPKASRSPGTTPMLRITSRVSRWWTSRRRIRP